MDGNKIVDLALEELRAAGADEAQVSLSLSDKSELNVDSGELSLFRTTRNAQLALVAYSGGRKGAVSLNKVDPASVREAARQALALAASAEPDPANAVAPPPPAGSPRSFSYGEAEPDRDAMYDRLKDFIAFAARERPKVKLEQCILDFTRFGSFFGNTKGVSFDAATSVYNLGSMFTAKDGPRTSSFNGSGASRRRLEGDFPEWGGIAELMRQSEEQLDTRAIEGKFVGDLVVTPHCLGDFVGGIDEVCLGDFAHISGTSPWKDALGAAVASPLLSLRSAPVSGEIAEGYFYTPDGFLAADCPILDKGILRNFTLSLYGSNKSGRPRCPSAGGAWTVDAGETPLAEVIGSVKRGLLLCRFSGGAPSSSGDLAGVAKNSYLIEDGTIAYPVSETMISANLCSLLKDISAVSRERIDFGSAVFPWVKMGGATISGK